MMPDLPLTIVYARSENHCIGNKGGVPWSLPAEYAFFERCIRDKAVIMGRRSYEDHNNLLPNCLNIVLSRQASLPLAPGAIGFSSLAEALEHAQKMHLAPCIIGGSKLIEATLPLASTVYESVVHGHIEGDVWVGEFSFDDFDSVIIDRHSADDRHLYSFEIRCHRRKTVSLS